MPQHARQKRERNGFGELRSKAAFHALRFGIGHFGQRFDVAVGLPCR